MNEKEKKELPKLARKAIEGFLKGEKVSYEKSKEKKGVFITLTKKGELRGCIGTLEPEEIHKAVVEKAIGAAFYDPRFEPVTEDELKDIQIEVSLLTKPEKCEIKDIKKGDGVIIKYGYQTATFLPQVWEDLKTKEEFMGHLCMKAGLEKDFWKTGKLKVQKYKAEKIKE
ncbi:AmmeMemoRadiSam system protein A [Candidatus Woesearchaeota archaeon]|nr:MAG: AmmeMemoRadiSam system protein A [Candidatus Woesearchaeota archaeon]